MPVPRKLLKAAFAALSSESLRAAAEYHELEDWDTRAPASLIAELGSDDGYNLSTFVYDLKAAELTEVAKALGVGLPSVEEGDIRNTIGTFIEDYEQILGRAGAAKHAAGLPVLTADDLTAEAASMERSVLLLKTRGVGRPVAVWNADHAPKTRGERPWITIDLRRHPDPALRRDGVLAVYADATEVTGRAAFTEDSLPQPEGKQIFLYGEEAPERPSLEVLFGAGSAKVQAWLDQMETHGWKLRGGSWGVSFPFHDVLESYRRAWQSGHALYAGNAAAQLGGWPVTWPDEGAEQQLPRPLVLRTYRASEPWVEVFAQPGGYEVCVRAT